MCVRRPHFFAKGVVINRSLDKYLPRVLVYQYLLYKRKEREREEKKKRRSQVWIYLSYFTRSYVFSVQSKLNIEQISALFVSDIY